MKPFFLIAIILTSCYRNHSYQPARDTKTIAFVKRTADVNHLWLMDINGSGVASAVRRITANGEAENYPSWSPDGKQLAYQRSLDGSGIYIVNADGVNNSRLSPTPGFDTTPSWSPDGTKIIYTRVKGNMVPGQVPDTDIRVMNADGSDDHAVLPNTAFSVEPRWSRRNQIVFLSRMNGGQQLFTMDLSGGHIKQLTTEGNNGDPVWSPDGSKISFGSDRAGNGKLNIFVMNADGSDQIQLTHFSPPVECGDTYWSEDGAQIAFEYDVSGRFQSDPNAYAEVWTMRSDGSNQRTTTQQCSAVGCAPRWRP